METLMRGAIAGLAGTAVMSAAMAAAKAAGMMAGEPPPRNIAGHLAEALGVRDDLPGPAFEATWIGQHFAYGAAAGVAYAMIEERLSPSRSVPAGLLYGAGLWAFGYAGWAPATGLYPWPDDQPRRRVGTEIVSHLVYGTVTAWTSRLLRASD